MKIKIPPFPNIIVADSAYEDVESKTVKASNSDPLSDNLILIAPFKTGKKRLLRVRPIEHENNKYLSAFPNPIHLFLSSAIEHYHIAENVKNTNFPKCGKKYGEDLFLLDIEENGTHTCYNNFIKYRCSSVIMLISSIEAFLNHIIPNDFIYKTTRKDKPIEFNKVNIESMKVSFREKLTKVIPQYLKKIDSETDLEIENTSILDLYSNRKNLIHLKTNAEDDLSVYFNEIDKMISFDLGKAIDNIISFMNKVEPNFVETQEN